MITSHIPRLTPDEEITVRVAAGEGAVQRCALRNSLLATADDVGISLYDLEGEFRGGIPSDDVPVGFFRSST